MKKPSVTFRSFAVALLMIPYLSVVLGMLSNYVAFYHRVSFQTQVATSQHEDLKPLTFSILEYKKIKWIEEGKEFEYQGKMYDVAKVEKHGRAYEITCENDSLEDLFINWLKSASKSKSKMIPQIQLSQPIAELKVEATTKTAEIIGQTPSSFYSSFLSEIIPPPPRAC